ncbi:MAG TPA: hypothetical protein VG755_39580 [Nannocystaceae bacterium]|nr:hypothetical protein [Nannocystaceae bacterium]
MTRDDDDEPAPLRADALQLVAHWREHDAMPRVSQARVWRRLEDEAPQPRAHGNARVWTIAFAVMAAAALVVAWWSFGPSRRTVAERGKGEQASDRRIGDDAKAAAQRTPEVATLPPAELPATPPAIAPAQPMPASPTKKEARTRTQAPEAAEPFSSTLAREKVLVERAWSALAAGDPDAALARVAEHAREIPDGVLAPERRAIAVIAHCKRGDANAAARARAWLAAEPDSPLSARVKAACPTE